MPTSWNELIFFEPGGQIQPCGLMWTHVGLMWTHVGLMWTHVGLMWTHVGLMWDSCTECHILALCQPCELMCVWR